MVQAPNIATRKFVPFAIPHFDLVVKDGDLAIASVFRYVRACRLQPPRPPSGEAPGRARREAPQDFCTVQGHNIRVLLCMS